MIDGSHPSHSSHSSSSDDRIRRKIEALGNSLSLPTVRKALGVLEGEHASNRRGGNDDPMDIRVYGPGDEARLIDWKASARLGRPMVVQHARQATSQVWLLCDVGEEMTGGCASGEPAYAVAGNALRMFAALSLRRSDDVSLVFADAHSITRMPFNGGFAQFERTLDDALRRDWSYGRNIDALLDYARRIRDRQALIVLATDELALRKRHINVIGAIAATHPVVLITVATANPFDPSEAAREWYDGKSGHRIPALLRNAKAAEEVALHRRYVCAALEHELAKHGSRMIRAASSDMMFDAIAEPDVGGACMNVMNGFVTSSTLAAAVDVNDLHPVTDVPVASLLPIVTMACFIALLILIVAIVIMSRPRRAKRVAAPRGSHNALAPVSQWKSRVHDIVERNGAGKLSREDAFVELAAVARDFASQASSAELGSTTLQEIASRSAGSLAGDSGVHGFTLLRQTIAALYPPEFANAEFNAQAKDATVEQAADWVLNLVERWR